jgi:polysaccharide pyruvyl transferase CsaB
MKVFLALARMLRPLLTPRYVVLHGYYGTGNIGDEAILEASLDEIQSITTLEPFVFAWQPDVVQARFGFRSLDPRSAPAWKVLSILSRSGVLALGGGGLLKDYGPDSSSLERWLRWLDVASRLGVPTMTWAVGVEKIVHPESKQRLVDVLMRTECVSVRDGRSAARLAELGVKREIVISADPAVLLARRAGRKVESLGSDPHVIVCLRQWYTTDNRVEDPEAFDRVLDTIARACDELHRRFGARITFLPFRATRGDDDREVGASVGSRMENAGAWSAAPYPESPRSAVELIASADVVIAMRLHATILATSMGIPAIALAYMPKVADYMDEIGQSGNCLDMGEVTATAIVDRVIELLHPESNARRTLALGVARYAGHRGRAAGCMAQLLPANYRRPSTESGVDLANAQAVTA